MLILTDVDGTVLDFFGAFDKWMNTKGHQMLHGATELYRLDLCYGVSEAQIMSLLNEFSASPHFEALEAEPCARVVLPELHAQGHTFVAITAVSPVHALVEARRRNLHQAFGFEWVDVLCVGHGADSKAPALDSYAPSIWVEDNWENAVIGAEAGHRTFLIDRPHNAFGEHALVERVKDWHEIAERLR